MRSLFAAALLVVAAPAAASSLIVDGAVPASLTLSRAALDGVPVAKGAWLYHGEPITCEGIWLIDLLAKAGVPTGDAVRGPALRLAVAASAADGYSAVFTLGELDRKLGNVPVLVADRCNGKPLTAEDGPFRLLAIGDQRGARSVRQLTRLTVREVPR